MTGRIIRVGARGLLGGLLLTPLPAPRTPVFAAEQVLEAMEAELQRNWKGLKNAEKVPLYHLGYTVMEYEVVTLSASLGAAAAESRDRWRNADVDLRVGSMTLDNTHEMKGADAWMNDASGHKTRVAIDDSPASLRDALWRLSDQAFKAAQNRYTTVQRNLAVTAAEEDASGDFSPRPPARFSEETPAPALDLEVWRGRVKKLSERFKREPFVYDSSVALSSERRRRWSVDSEGTRLKTGAVYLRLSYNLATRTHDGMDLNRSERYDADRPEDLPSDETVLADMERSIAELEALRRAPLVEPYSGPAILRNRACAVYFHEILGHRLEGQRQKSEQEGQTFAKKLGQPVVADFISVSDDPTRRRFGAQFLRGHYRYDDEGTAARPTVLVQDGVLKGFLMSRSPVRGFPASNGHGRRESGLRAVARMGNLFVTAARTVPYDRLRAALVAEIRRQGKPYGLVFDDISGGFTRTRREGPQSFKVLPLLVYRVYPDGRPDEAVRGVDIVGTPLTSFTKILAAADDPAVFNGSCGAESGWVPVSAVAPSVLISEMEVEKRKKAQEKPPMLPPPHHDAEGLRAK